MLTIYVQEYISYYWTASHTASFTNEWQIHIIIYTVFYRYICSRNIYSVSTKKANETSKSISIVWFLHSDLRNNCKSQYDYVFRITCVMVIPVLSVKCLRQVTFWQQKKTDSKKYKHRNLLSINLACCWTISPSQIDWDPNLLWGHIFGLSSNLRLNSFSECKLMLKIAYSRVLNVGQA